MCVCDPLALLECVCVYVYVCVCVCVCDPLALLELKKIIRQPKETRGIRNLLSK